MKSAWYIALFGLWAVWNLVNMLNANEQFMQALAYITGCVSSVFMGMNIVVVMIERKK